MTQKCLPTLLVQLHLSFLFKKWLSETTFILLYFCEVSKSPLKNQNRKYFNPLVRCPGGFNEKSAVLWHYPFDGKTITVNISLVLFYVSDAEHCLHKLSPHRPVIFNCHQSKFTRNKFNRTFNFSQTWNRNLCTF